MLEVSKNKYKALERLSDQNGIIASLAIDQRESLSNMIKAEKGNVSGSEDLVEFKKLISEELTPFASSILLDPEYGIPAAKVRDDNSGLLVAYEISGYDPNVLGRLPRLLPNWSARRLKEAGADAVKFLLYYDVDEDEKINEFKHVFIERIGSECIAEEIPFFLEILTYDVNIIDTKGKEYAKVKPHKVINAMREFSKPQYHVDVLKVEVPVNMNYVEGFTNEEPTYTVEEAIKYFKEQSDATHLPFIFLSAGVSAQLFQDTLRFAHKADSNFNGVLCGRATWKGAIGPFATGGEKACRKWLKTNGIKNIQDLNTVIEETAVSWKNKVRVKD